MRALTILAVLVPLGLVASLRAAAGGNVVDKTIQELLVPRAPDQAFCYDTPLYDLQGRERSVFAFVTTTIRPRVNGVCRDWVDGDELAIYIKYGDRYREITVIRGEGILSPKLFVYSGTASKPMPQQVLLGVETEYSGTGNMREYQLFRVTTNSTNDVVLEPIPITSAAEVISSRLGKGQGVVGPGYGFEDNRITFGMSITNGSESTRFPTGGSAYGDMMLVPAAKGFTLVPDPDSLQLPSESNRLNDLALAAYRAGKYDEALEQYRRALDWDHRNYDAAANLGLLYMRRKEWNAAIEISTRVIESQYASRAIRASAAYNAGRAFEAVGDSRRAAASYRMAIEFQDSPERRAALARLCPGAGDCK